MAAPEAVSSAARDWDSAAEAVAARSRPVGREDPAPPRPACPEPRVLADKAHHHLRAASLAAAAVAAGTSEEEAAAPVPGTLVQRAAADRRSPIPRRPASCIRRDS